MLGFNEEDRAVENIKSASMALLKEEPFFGHLLLSLRLVNVEGIPRLKDMVLGTDGINLIYKPSWINSLTRPHLIGVLAHEVLHIALLHPIRRGDRNPLLFNIAGDCAINLMLHNRGYDLPPSVTSQVPFQVYNHDTTEDIYERLLDLCQDGAEMPDGCKGASAGAVMDMPGSGSDKNDGQGDQDGEGPGQADGEDKNDTDLMKGIAVAARKAKEAGNMPGDLEAMIDRNFHGQREWRDELRQYLGGGQQKEPSWARPNRRFIHSGDYIPGAAPYGPGQVAVVIDSSGSVDDQLVSKFVGEISKIHADLHPEKLFIIVADCRVQWTGVFDPYDELDVKVKGRGGTAFSPSFEWIAQNAPDVKAICYFTDLEVSDWGERPLSAEVRWIVWPGGSSVNPPFGSRIEMT